jgi:hypothetical protein
VPICEIDPWRTQYFETTDCPADVFIPTEDSDAWLWNPDHRWVYDKLTVATRQGLAAAPHGIEPSQYPVFSKPIYNLKGMGVGSRTLHSVQDYQDAYRAGHMWMPLLEGGHVSSDVALVDGTPRWWGHASGTAGVEGTFDYWEVQAGAEPEIERYAGDWCRRHLVGYTGMANLETIGGRIIEVHLRFADQWPDLYGRGWVEALIRLYARGDWVFRPYVDRAGYSVVLFMPHGRSYLYPPGELLNRVKAIAGVSSVQITFHENMAPERHAMPPGGFRVAIVNCWDLAAGRRARDLLREHFA